MTETISPQSTADTLLTSFAISLGMEPDPSQPLLAVEFASGDHVAALFPHPGREDLFCVEISLRGLALGEGGAESASLLFLHRLNAAARHDHSWVISIDGDDMLLLSAAFPLSGLDNELLAGHLAEGFQRAESLDRLWQGLHEGTEEIPGSIAEWGEQATPLQLA